MVKIITKKELADIREGNGIAKVELPTAKPKKPISERIGMMEKLNKAGIEFKGNAKNQELRDLVKGIK